METEKICVNLYEDELWTAQLPTGQLMQGAGFRVSNLNLTLVDYKTCY